MVQIPAQDEDLEGSCAPSSTCSARPLFGVGSGVRKSDDDTSAMASNLMA